FSLHTSFEGSLLDSFHVELQEFREFREFRLRRHSVPPFIPLERLSQEFLPKDPRQFLAILFQHLNAFVARRHHLDSPKFLNFLSKNSSPFFSQNSFPNFPKFFSKFPIFQMSKISCQNSQIISKSLPKIPNIWILSNFSTFFPKFFPDFSPNSSQNSFPKFPKFLPEILLKFFQNFSQNSHSSSPNS
uniref:Centromere protein O n=1 Tax=Ficedula albicollis TaxID=59894 RepID=A0A803W9K9_FICAL